MMAGFKNVFPRNANLNLMVLAGSAGKTFAASRIMLPPTLEYASGSVHALMTTSHAFPSNQ
jgi:hypothetical protein